MGWNGVWIPSPPHTIHRAEVHSLSYFLASAVPGHATPPLSTSNGGSYYLIFSNPPLTLLPSRRIRHAASVTPLPSRRFRHAALVTPLRSRCYLFLISFCSNSFSLTFFVSLKCVCRFFWGEILSSNPCNSYFIILIFILTGGTCSASHCIMCCYAAPHFLID